MVDSRYIVGNELDTVQGVCIELDVNNYAKGASVYEGTSNGDGTVTTYSATIGNTVSSSRIYYTDADHTDLVSAEDCLEKIISYIELS